jgi:multidrug efflux pump subunit AcrB
MSAHVPPPAALGTRGWCEARGGRLRTRDRLVLVGLLVRAQFRDVAECVLPTDATTPGGAAVALPLGAVAQVTRATAPGRIDRLGLQRVVTLSAATAPELSLSDASAQVGAVIDGDGPRQAARPARGEHPVEGRRDVGPAQRKPRL